MVSGGISFGLFSCKPISDIAVKAAVLPVPVSIGCELLTAAGADKLVVCFPVGLVSVFTPPFPAALITAEYFLFPLWILFDRRSAVLAMREFHIIVCADLYFLFRYSGKTVPPAV